VANESPIAETKIPFEALRRFARRTPERVEEHCDLCGAVLGPDHRHMLDLTERRVLCTCRACALLLDAPAAGGGVRRVIPTQVLNLVDFEMSDAEWENLQIPVNMTFFVYNTAAQRMLAFYPSPMGPTESLLSLAAWDELVVRNPILRELESDVEALLIHRTPEGRDYLIVPIDECYKLVGLIRLHWKGIHGGSAVHEAIARFFAGLKERAERVGGVHA
jgi:Family of unknown function (DUF5947)